MKGATQLLDVARELRSLNVNFHLSICGDGELKGKMSQDIQASNLSEHVSMEGTLDFKTGLVPFVRSKIDMFVCCHPQGDPLLYIPGNNVLRRSDRRLRERSFRGSRAEIELRLADAR